MSQILFVIDTNSYAGNFERELTAYCTGIVGELGNGEEEAANFKKRCADHTEIFEDLVELKNDEHGYPWPCEIYPTPGFFNDGMGNEYPDSEWGSKKVVDAYRKEIRSYQKQHPGSLPEDDPKTALPSRAPSYQSVAIYLNGKPGQELAGFLRTRAQEYAKKHKFKILGFRLLLQSRTTKLLEEYPGL
jgi:hypothetical protein